MPRQASCRPKLGEQSGERVETRGSSVPRPFSMQRDHSGKQCQAVQPSRATIVLRDTALHNGINGLVAEYIIAIDVTQARFPADAFCGGADAFTGSRRPRAKSRSTAPSSILERGEVEQKRQRGDPNPCGQSPMDFEPISLTARTHGHMNNLQLERPAARATLEGASASRAASTNAAGCSPNLRRPAAEEETARCRGGKFPPP